MPRVGRSKPAKTPDIALRPLTAPSRNGCQVRPCQAAFVEGVCFWRHSLLCGRNTHISGLCLVACMTCWRAVARHHVTVCQIDTVKTRLQLQGELGATRQYGGMLDALKKIAAEEGFSGWFKGISPALLRQATYGTIRYGAYEVRCHL